MNQLVQPMDRKKKFYIPSNIIANRCDELVDSLKIINENHIYMDIHFNSDGNLYIMPTHMTVKDGFDIFFTENKRLAQKRSDVMFKMKKAYKVMCFSKGLKTGIFCSLKAKWNFGLVGKSYLHCEILHSSSSLCQKVDYQIEENFKLHSKVDRLIAVEISSTSKFFVVVYKCKEKTMCEFLSLFENEGNIDNSCNNQQLELTKIFPERDIMLRISFNEADTLCFFYSGSSAAVYSMQEKLLFTISQTPGALKVIVESIFHVNDSRKGDFCVYHELYVDRVDRVIYNLITCFTVKPMCLERVLKFKLSELGIKSVCSICVSSFTKKLLFAANSKSIYVVDLCQFSEQPVLLRTIDLECGNMQANLLVNWTGEELIYYYEDYKEHRNQEYCLKVYHLNQDYSGKKFSLLNFARKVVLTIYSSEQLRELNLPKLFNYYLGL